MISLSAVAD